MYRYIMPLSCKMIKAYDYEVWQNAELFLLVEGVYIKTGL